MSPHQSAGWVGGRNYQARNYMRDQMRLGDCVLIYHSNAKPSCVAGVATVARTSYPDYSAWDLQSPYFDPKSSPENPRWFMVDVRFESEFEIPQSLEMLREHSKLSEMVLLRKGMRLSVQTVAASEFDLIVKLGRPLQSMDSSTKPNRTG